MTVFLITMAVVATAALLCSGKQVRTLWRTVRPDWPRRAVRRLRQRLRPGRHRDLDELPGHLERVQEIGDPADDETFGDIAEQLLDGRLADVAEKAGWLR